MGFMTQKIQTTATKKEVASANKVANVIVGIVITGVLVCVAIALSGAWGTA